MDGASATRLAALAAPAAGGLGVGIGFAGVTVAYGGAVALAELSLEVRRGEILALIGPSGSGKTTALRAVAGFVRPSAGRVVVAGRDVTELAPAERGIGMVVQSYALFAHMRVAENVAFGLAARGVAKAEQRARTMECLRLVGMEEFAGRLPRQLSGGQQQRVAIARALAIRPPVLLLDEPFSALDAQIRRSMIEEVARLHAAMPELTILHVTHDQTEALSLAHRIGILRDGRLEAAGSSRDLYQTPPTRFAAEFLGRANLLAVVALGDETARDGMSGDGMSGDGMSGNGLAGGGTGFAVVRFGEAVLRARGRAGGGPVGSGIPGSGRAGGGRMLLCVRPHALRLGAAENAFAATVAAVRWQGEAHAVELVAGSARLQLTSTVLREPPRVGDVVTVGFDPRDATLLDDA